MIDTSLASFLQATNKGNEPILAFKWVCTSLPYGLDVKHVEQANLPFVKLNLKDGLFAAATYTYYPGFSSIDQFTLSLRENVNGDVIRWLLGWFSKIKNFETGAYFLPKDYKENLSFCLINNQNKPVVDITMINCWPIIPDPLDLNYTDKNGYIKYNVQFSADNQIIRPYKTGYTANPTQPTSFPTASNSTRPSIPGQPNSQRDVQSSAIFEPVTYTSTGQRVPLQNPTEPVAGMFEAKGNASVPASQAQPTFLQSLMNKTTESVTKAINNFSDVMVDAIKDGDPSSVEDVRNIVNQTVADQSVVAAANVTGDVSRVMFDDLIKTPQSEREEKQDANSGFLAELLGSLRNNAEDYGDSVINAAENASDPQDIKSFAEYAASDTDSFKDNVLDDAADSAEKYYT